MIEIEKQLLQMTRLVNRIYFFIDFNSNVSLEQNDLFILNVYSVPYIELIIYMFQDVLDDVCIHLTPELNRYLIRVISRFQMTKLHQG